VNQFGCLSLWLCVMVHFWLVPVLCCAVLCCAVLCCAVLCCAVLCCAVLCCAVLCCAVLCCAVLCCAVQEGLPGLLKAVQAKDADIVSIRLANTLDNLAQLAVLQVSSPRFRAKHDLEAGGSALGAQITVRLRLPSAAP